MWYCWKYLDNLGWVSQHQYNFDNVIDERFLGNAQCAGCESQNKSFEQQRLSLKRNIFQPEIDDISLHTIWTEWPVFMMEHKHLNSFEQTIKVRCEIQSCLKNEKNIPFCGQVYQEKNIYLEILQKALIYAIFEKISGDSKISLLSSLLKRLSSYIVEMHKIHNFPSQLLLFRKMGWIWRKVLKWT